MSELFTQNANHPTPFSMPYLCNKLTADEYSPFA